MRPSQRVAAPPPLASYHSWTCHTYQAHVLPPQLLLCPALLKLTPCLSPSPPSLCAGSTPSQTGGITQPSRRCIIMRRRANTERPALAVARAATSAVALCGFLGRVGKGVNAFAFSSCAHRRTCSLASMSRIHPSSRSKVCKQPSGRRAGGQDGWRPLLPRRSGRGGFAGLRSSEEDEEAAREEVRLYLLSYTPPVPIVYCALHYVLYTMRHDMHYAQERRAAVCM